MNVYFIVAAVFTFFMGLAHSLMGERYFLPQLFKRDLPGDLGTAIYVNRTTRIAWHLTTIAWWNAALILLILAFREFDQSALIIGRIISNIFLLSGIVSLLGSRGRHISWVVFFLISLIAWLGTV